MWWPVMQSLGAHLKADPNLAGIEVNFGLKNPVPEADTIDLRYGGSPVFDMDDGDNGQSRLWLDVWKKLDPADAETGHETGAAYSQLYDLVNLTLASVREWWTETETIGGATWRTAVEKIDPDGDEFRDYQVAASRIIIIIHWQDIGG